MRRSLTVWLLKAACTVLLLMWLFSRPEARGGLRQFGQMASGWLAAGFLMAGISQAFTAWRWHVCLHTAGTPLPVLTVFRLTLISTAAGFLSIGTLGADAVRLAFAARRHPGKKAALLGSIGMDHVSAAPAFGLMALLVASSAGVKFSAGPWSGLMLLGGIAGFFAVGLVLKKFRPVQHDRLRAFLLETRTRRGLARAALLSLPVMFTHYAVFFCAARALGVEVPPVPFAAAAAAADVLASLPLTLAGLGVREKTFETLLGLWQGVPPAAAIALSLAGLGLILLWGLAGALCLLAEKPAPPSPPPAAP